MSDPKCAIVTGSATGIGAATALALARRGWRVVINYARSATEAAETERACREAGAADTLCLQADVADDTACRGLVEAAVARWGRLDALVNNAGVTTFAGPAQWDTLDAEVFQRIMGVNVVGTFQMVRAAAPHLTAAHGTVVNVSSVAGVLGTGSSAPYVASKGAVNALTLHLARVLAPAVRVNAVCPGMVTTRWFPQGVGEEAFATLKAQYERQVPLGCASSAEDVADAVLFLIEGARTVTGELLMLDAGMHLGAAPARLQPPAAPAPAAPSAP